MDVSNTMPASPETSAASTVSQRLGKVSSGNAALNSITSFADILQVSLQESAASLDRAAHSSSEGTKVQSKGTSKKSDTTDASLAGAGDSTQTSSVWITSMATAMAAPVPVQTPAPLLAASPNGNCSDGGGTSGRPSSAIQPSSNLETAASTQTSSRSNFARALSKASTHVEVAASQSAQTSVADTADLADAAQATAASGNTSPIATGSNITSLNSPVIQADDPAPPATGASGGTSPANTETHANGSQSTELSSGKLTAESDDSEENGASVKSSTESASAGDAPTVPADPQQTVPTAGTSDTQDNSVQSAQSRVASGPIVSGTISDVTIPAELQNATSGADTSQTPVSKSVDAPPVTDRVGSKQTTNTSATPIAHPATQNANALSTISIHHAHVAAEPKHSQSSIANPDTTLLTKLSASAVIPVTRTPSASNSENTAAEHQQTDTTAQGQQAAVPNAADTTQTNGTPGAQLPSQLNLPSSNAKHDNKSDKVPAVAEPSEAAGTTTVTTTATAQTTTTVPASDTGTFAKSAVPAPSTTPSHEPSGNSSTAQVLDDGPELSQAMHAWNGGETLQANLSGTPHLVEKLGQSEMNIAMQADALGAVQVRAHVVGNQVGAAIIVEHHDVHAMLSNDLPSLHQAFAEKQLRVDNVSVQQGYFAGGGISDGRSGQQQPQQGSAQRPYPIADTPQRFSGEPIFSTSADSSESRGSVDSQGRLSVRA